MVVSNQSHPLGLGSIAQSGLEHLFYKQGVTGSNPVVSTRYKVLNLTKMEEKISKLREKITELLVHDADYGDTTAYEACDEILKYMDSLGI